MNFKSICGFLILIVAIPVTTTTSPHSKEVQDQLESNLLSLFGFKYKPKIDKSKIVIPRAMVELYEKQAGVPFETASIPKRGLRTQSANTVRSFTHIESPVDQRFPGHHKFRLKFNLSSVPQSEVIKAAELTLTREISDSFGDGSPFQRILVNDIIKPGVKLKRSPIIRLIDSKLVDIRKNTTLSFDIYPAVYRWLKDSSSNHGILITILNVKGNNTPPVHHVRLRRHVNTDDLSWATSQPLLFTYTDDGKNKQKSGMELTRLRPKRSPRRGKRKEEPCRRHSMYVDFTGVGWNDWIVAPPGYDAFYCSGECNFPLADHLNTTNHAIVQTLMNSVSPTKVPKTCCVPSQFNSISMLYLDDDKKVVLKNYKEMVVLGCGCR